MKPEDEARLNNVEEKMRIIRERMTEAENSLNDIRENQEPIPQEPAEGACIHFTHQFRSAGVSYSFLAIRIGHTWRTTSTRVGSGYAEISSAASWKEIVDFADNIYTLNKSGIIK